MALDKEEEKETGMELVSHRNYTVDVKKSASAPLIPHINTAREPFRLMVVNLGTTTIAPVLLMEVPVPYFCPVLPHSVAGSIFANEHTWKEQRHFNLVALSNLGLGKKSLEAWLAA